MNRVHVDLFVLKAVKCTLALGLLIEYTLHYHLVIPHLNVNLQDFYQLPHIQSVAWKKDHQERSLEIVVQQHLPYPAAGGH